MFIEKSLQSLQGFHEINDFAFTSLFGLYQLPKPDRDGRTVISLTPLEFLDRLAHQRIYTAIKTFDYR